MLTYFTVFINNHTAIWGSWYQPSSGTWGYACCQSTLHISYCAGQAGIEAARASSAQHLLASSSGPPSSATAAETASKPLTETCPEEVSRDRVEQNFSKKRVGEGDVKLDNERLARAIQEEKKRKIKGDEDGDRFVKKIKGGGPEGGSHDVTEEELGTLLLALWYLVRLFISSCRGISDKSSTDRGSHGKLCRYGRLSGSYLYF